MKKALVLLALVAGFAHADNKCDGITSADKATDNTCTDYAVKALAKKLKVDAKGITFFNGATVGDGAWSIEIDMFKVKGTDGLYKVELDADGCTTRGVQFIN